MTGPRMMRPVGGHVSPYTIDVPGREIPPLPPPAQSLHFQRTVTVSLSGFSLAFAAIAAIAGMSLGIFMGIAQDFTLSPAHAHLNLLGFVTMAIFGLYHRTVGRTSGLAGWLQVGTSALGAVLMSGGLALYLATQDERLVPLIIVGSLLALAGMLMFLGLVLSDLRHRPTAGQRTAARSG